MALFLFAKNRTHLIAAYLGHPLKTFRLISSNNWRGTGSGSLLSVIGIMLTNIAYICGMEERQTVAEFQHAESFTKKQVLAVAFIFLFALIVLSIGFLIAS